MKYCEHCGGKIRRDDVNCSNCGAPVTKGNEEEVFKVELVNNKETDDTKIENAPIVKDNTGLAFGLSLFGALCCTYAAIPGLILSIQALQQMKEGKISDKNKWMAIVGIVLSAIGLLQMVWNFTHMDEANQRVQDIINRVNENTN